MNPTVIDNGTTGPDDVAASEHAHHLRLDEPADVITVTELAAQHDAGAGYTRLREEWGLSPPSSWCPVSASGW